MKKRLLASLLCLAMVLALLPTVAFATDPVTLTINGGTYDGTVDQSGEGWKWIPSDDDYGSLILNNYDGGPISCDSGMYVFLAANTKNKVTVPAGSSDDAIYAYSSVYIEGYGDLEITAPNSASRGIVSETYDVGFYYFGGNATVNVGGDGISAYYEFYPEYSDGSLTITAGGDGIVTEDDDIYLCYYSGMTFSITAGGTGLNAYGDFYLTDEGEADATIEAGANGIEAYSFCGEYGSANLSITAPNGYGIKCEGNVCTYEYSGDTEIDAGLDGIYSENGYVEFEYHAGDISITAGGDGIYAGNYFETDDFLGDLTIEADGDGILTVGYIEFDYAGNGDVSITTGGDGLHTTGTDGEIEFYHLGNTVIDADGYGMRAEQYYVYFEPYGGGGTCQITAGQDGVYSGNATSECYFEPYFCDTTINAEGDGIVWKAASSSNYLYVMPYGCDLTINAGGKGIRSEVASVYVETYGADLTILSDGDGVYSKDRCATLESYGGEIEIIAGGYGVWSKDYTSLEGYSNDPMSITAANDAIYSDDGAVYLEEAVQLNAVSTGGNAIGLGGYHSVYMEDIYGERISLTAGSGKKAVYCYKDGSSPMDTTGDYPDYKAVSGGVDQQSVVLVRGLEELKVDGAPVTLGSNQSGTGWSWTDSTRTLTLNGYNGGAISATGSLNIVLTDGTENVINGGSDVGLYVEYGDLSISGDADLTVKSATKQGVYTYGGDLTLDIGGDLEVETQGVKPSQSDYIYGVYLYCGSLTGEVGGDLSVSAPNGEYGLYVDNALDLTVGGDMTASAGYGGLEKFYGDGRLDVAGNLSLKGTGSSSYGMEYYGNMDLHVGGDAEIGGVEYGIGAYYGAANTQIDCEGEMTVSGGDTGFYAYYNNALSFTGNKLNINSDGYGIYGYTFALDIGEGADVSINAASSYGIYAYDNCDIDVAEGAKLSLKAYEEAIDVYYGDLTIRNKGEFTIESLDGEDGICMDYAGRATIDNDGTFTIKDTYYAIFTEYGPAFIDNSGEFTIEDSNYGVYTYYAHYEINNTDNLTLTAGLGAYEAYGKTAVFKNSGTANITATGSDGFEIYYAGMDLTNSGKLTVSATASGANGIGAWYGILDLVNNGTLDVTADDTGIGTYGILTLSGKGSTTVKDADYALYNYYGPIILKNSGPVTATGMYSVYLADEYGVDTKLLLEGTGSPITLTSTGGEGYPAVYRYIDGSSPVAGSKLSSYSVTGAPEQSKVVYGLSTPVYYGGEDSYPIAKAAAKNGSFAVSCGSAEAGKTVTVTVTPDEGFAVDAVTVTDNTGKSVSVTGAGDNKYTFTMPASAVTVSVTFKESKAAEEEETTASFVDVKESDYFYDAVQWAAEKGITKGIDATHFGPTVGTTRAQVVTFLWRASGCPEPTGTAEKFTDLKPGEYYQKAIAWAIEQGITKGTSATTFSPDEVCTRAQITTFLARYAGVEDADTESTFSDVKATDYFAAAVKWAKDNGVTDGVSKDAFGPNQDCTRAQTVTFLYRWVEK